MSKIEHKAASGVVTLEMVEALVSSLEREASRKPNWHRVRATLNQLYSTAVQNNSISKALLRDIEAGDKILSQRAPERGNPEGKYTPETTAWLEWLATFHLAQKLLPAVDVATSAVDTVAETIDRQKVADAMEILKSLNGSAQKEAA